MIERVTSENLEDVIRRFWLSRQGDVTSNPMFFATTVTYGQLLLVMEESSATGRWVGLERPVLAIGGLPGGPLREAVEAMLRPSFADWHKVRVFMGTHTRDRYLALLEDLEGGEVRCG